MPKNNLKVQVVATRSEELPHAPAHLTSTQALEPISDVCQSAVELLANLCMVIEQIPDDKPPATTALLPSAIVHSKPLLICIITLSAI